MSRKTRRARVRPSIPPTEPRSPIATRVPAERPETSLHTAIPAATSGSKRVDFSAEYHYVIGDLRKMAIIAASMFIVLIALSFIIR